MILSSNKGRILGEQLPSLQGLDHEIYIEIENFSADQIKIFDIMYI